jgi:hypothetical protein
VSFHSIAGLVALNLWFLVVGGAVLFGVRGWRSWGELVRLSGFAYLLGVATLGIVWTWELVVGLRMGFALVFATGIGCAAAAVALGVRLGRRLPATRVRTASWPRVSPFATVAAALTVVYLEALFRSGRLAGLDEFDAWDFWVPKAKAIYYFGGFDHQFFREIAAPSYPPLVPVVDAAAFHFMGSADVVTLHLQFWFLIVGFVTALVGLLSSRAPAYFVWPPLLLLLVTPHVALNAVAPLADFALDEFFAVATLCLTLWLLERRNWQLAGAVVLLAAAMLTKREGYLYGATAIVAALAVTWSARRTAWPRLVAAGVLAAAATVPWRILVATRHYAGGGPEAGGTGLFAHADRAWPSLRLALSSMFDFGIWLVTVPLLLCAVAVAFAAGARRLPSYVVALVVLAVAGYTWTTWAFPTVPITKNASLNPIVRLTGELALLTPALVPLLLATTTRGVRRRAP